MPTIPVVVPLLVTGILFGRILHAKKEQVGRRLGVWACLLGGLGNAANAAILYLLPGQATAGPPTGQGPVGSSITFTARQVATTQTPLSFLLLSFVVGVLIVALVVVSAVLTKERTFPRIPLPGLPFRKEEEDSLE
jgi:hypothetical protein